MYSGFPDYVLAGNGVSIAFNNGSFDTNGSMWTLDGPLTGWDSPDGRVTMLPKIGIGPDADGEIPADQHYRGRTLTFKLICAATSEVNREKSKYLLAHVLDLTNSTGTLQVNEDTPKFVVISRSGNNSQGKLTLIDQGFSGPAAATPGFTPPQVDANGLLYLFEANVEVYAQDPRKYAVTPITQSWGAVTSEALSNPGNTPTQHAVFTMSPGGPFTMTFPTGALHFVVPTVPAGAPPLSGIPGTLDIDLYNKTIQDGSGNNFFYLRDLQVGPWPQIDPGSSTFDPDNVAGSLTYYPAWL